MTLIEHYARIEAAGRRMLAAARDGDWDAVVAIEHECRALIDALHDAARGRALSRDEDRERLAILRRLVDIDAEIRLLAQPWLADLDMITSARRWPLASRRLH